MTFAAKRLELLPPYLFEEIDRAKAAALTAGRDVIDLGVGDPDRPTHPFLLEAMSAALRHPENHRYAETRGSTRFREAAARFCESRFGVSLDPASEVITVLGTKEGIGHLPTAVVNPGDVVLVPDPGYPVYTSGAIFAGAEVFALPLAADRGWLLNLDAIPSEIRERARLLFLNYPNNPTSGCASLSFFEEVVSWARKHDILVAQDAAYSELYFDQAPPSILQVEKAKDVAIEFHSLSKTFNMTGWRIGFAAGNQDALSALAGVKSNLDSGAFGAIQEVGAIALDQIGHDDVRKQRDIYGRRRDALVRGLQSAGWEVKPPAATFYVWGRCPQGWTSMETASHALEAASVVVIPGVGFGAGGEGYVRFALTVDESRIHEACERIGGIQW